VVIGMLFAVIAMVFNCLAAILQSDAAGQVTRTSAVLARPRFVMGLGVDVLAYTCVVIALQHLPVFAVQATVAGAIALTALYARFVKLEILRPVHRIAIGASMLGLVLVALSAGSDKGVRHGTPTTTVVVMALSALVLVILTAATRRVWKPWPSGIMAGLGLGGGSVCVRAMELEPGNIVVALLTEPLVYVLIALWATGLYNYARALRLGDVATVTALYMVTQVIVPGLVGIVLLGDRVRNGWEPVAVIGLLMAVYGVLVLARRKPVQRRPARVT
jgi:drug/metabolite transporter (DMT)-like permease